MPRQQPKAFLLALLEESSVCLALRMASGTAEASAAAHWFAEQLYDNGTDQQTIFEEKLRVRTFAWLRPPFAFSCAQPEGGLACCPLDVCRGA